MLQPYLTRSDTTYVFSRRTWRIGAMAVFFLTAGLALTFFNPALAAWALLAFSVFEGVNLLRALLGPYFETKSWAKKIYEPGKKEGGHSSFLNAVFRMVDILSLFLGGIAWYLLLNKPLQFLMHAYQLHTSANGAEQASDKTSLIRQRNFVLGQALCSFGVGLGLVLLGSVSLFSQSPVAVLVIMVSAVVFGIFSLVQYAHANDLQGKNGQESFMATKAQQAQREPFDWSSFMPECCMRRSAEERSSLSAR